MQHPYVYGVLVFEAMATFIGQVSVLSLIALFGAATTAMVCIYVHFSPAFLAASTLFHVSIRNLCNCFISNNLFYHYCNTIFLN